MKSRIAVLLLALGAGASGLYEPPNGSSRTWAQHSRITPNQCLTPLSCRSGAISRIILIIRDRLS